jgi:CRISPR-associated protein Cmr6
MATGIVVKWNGQTGVIQDDADQAQCFFGDRRLLGLMPADVSIGLQVEFDREPTTRGLEARNVRRPGPGSGPPPRPASTPVGRMDGGRGPRRGGDRGGDPPRPRQPGAPSHMSDGEILGHVPVPESLRSLLAEQKNAPSRHPGLMLDRFLAPCPKQEQQRDVLRLVAGLGGNPDLLDELRRRRAEGLAALGARTWTRTTQGPLTLHLARASALENAGLCLHPIYGFTYLPGTGLKGMARAYAETVWLPAQPDPAGSWQKIEQVFGWAPGSDEIGRDPKPWKPKGVPKHEKKDSAASGAVVFHDAWPEKWPALLVDIVNNHHPEYYQGKEPPGDWQSPVPVYFLAVKGGTTFGFALGKRREDVPDEVLDLACSWLDGALTSLGCGAKTAAGYGSFAPAPGQPAVKSPLHTEVSYKLELVTPAYLAGAGQLREDCDLRSATLRGLLRWWWRTMYSGFLPWQTLRDLEAAVWGDTESSGAVQLRVTRLSANVAPSPYKVMEFNQKKQKEELRFDRNFARNHEIPLDGGPPGLAYAGYGMDEMAQDGDSGNARRRRRWCVEPGAQWRVDLAARPGMLRLHDRMGKVARVVALPDAGLLLDQARTALWWFCTLGGAGSKSRKGFGSFQLPAELEKFAGNSVRPQRARLLAAAGLSDSEFDPNLAEWPALRLMLGLSRQVVGQARDWISVQTKWNDPWRVLDLIGWAMQRCAQSDQKSGHGKHCPQKRGLGLPRKIDGPNRTPLRHQNPTTHRPPVELDCSRGQRHSSPVLFHVARGSEGLEIHVAGFPTADLRPQDMTATAGLAEHERFLADYLRHLQQELNGALR